MATKNLSEYNNLEDFETDAWFENFAAELTLEVWEQLTPEQQQTEIKALSKSCTEELLDLRQEFAELSKDSGAAAGDMMLARGLSTIAAAATRI